MITLRLVLLGLAGCTLLVGSRPVLAQTSEVEPIARAVPSELESGLRERTEAAFGLRESRIVRLGQLSRHGSVAISIDDVGRRIEFWPHDVRGNSYQLLVESADGMRSIEPFAAQTIRGRIAGLPGAEIAGRFDKTGLSALVFMPDGSRRWIEPLADRVAGAQWGQHVVYRDEDRVAAPRCAAITPLSAAFPSHNVAAGSSEPNDLRFTELAIDTDVEYFTMRGSVEEVEAEVTNVINIVNLQYERDVRISYLLAHLIVRTTESDPYNTRDPSSLLDQFRNHWFALQTGVARDVAQLFTGKVLNNNLAGLAYFSGICSDVEGYSIVSQPACPALACKTDLSAHELGHGWAAPHCNCPGWTMNPTIQSANEFHPEFTIPLIENYRDSVDCLEIGDDLVGLTALSPIATIAETNSVALAASAQFRLHADRDVTSQVAWSVIPASLGEVTAEGLFTAYEVSGPVQGSIEAAYGFGGTLLTSSISLTLTDATPAPLRDLVQPEKNRYISLAVPQGLGQVAIRIRMLSLYRPDPPHAPSVSIPDYSGYEGEIRWVGPPSMCQDFGGFASEFPCALIQCEPYYADDWGNQVIHVTGGDIVPSSEYEVRTFPIGCDKAEDTCGMASAPLIVRTQRWGDIVPPFQAPGVGSATQPNVVDLAAVVDKLKAIPTAISQPMADLHGNVPEPSGGISILEVADVVDAIKGFAPLTIGPCPCTNLSTCPLTDHCGRCNP